MRIALFRGSFNPPTLSHRAIVQRLAEDFDEVHVIPHGPDQPGKTSIPASCRAALVDLAFGGMEKVHVDLLDLEHSTFTSNRELQKLHAQSGEVWHVVDASDVRGGAQDGSEIQRSWEDGMELWKVARFVVLAYPGDLLEPSDLPVQSQVVHVDEAAFCADIRDSLDHGEPVRSLLLPKVLAYIERYGLYRAPNPGSWARGSLKSLPFFLDADVRNEKAKAWCEQMGAGAAVDEASFVNVLGGDGTMLRSIREHWRRRLPFFGVNAGNLGFLMNAPDKVLKEGAFQPGEVVFHRMPMLFLELEDKEGNIRAEYGFNDAWVERASSQSAWLEVSVNGVTRLPKLVSDGALVATAAGSTAYARSMGASPLLADTPAWLLVGSNVLQPSRWNSALLSSETVVEIRNLSPEKRPLNAYVDGKLMGEVVTFRARLSRAAAAELVFCASHDMAEKIADIQFGR